MLGALQSSWSVFVTPDSGVRNIQVQHRNFPTPTSFFLVSQVQVIPLPSPIISVQALSSPMQSYFKLFAYTFLPVLYFEPPPLQWGKAVVPRPLPWEPSKASLLANKLQRLQLKVIQLCHWVQDISFHFKDSPIIPSDVAALMTRKAKSDAYSTAHKSLYITI